MNSSLTEAELTDLTRARLTFNAPLSEQRLAGLADRLDIDATTRVVDLGCGDGELLMRLCQGGASGDGVDLDARAIERARRHAEMRGLAERVSFHVDDATSWSEPRDLVVCVGAAHVWEGHRGALSALRDGTRPGGRLLYGDGFWSREPSAQARDIFGDLPVLSGLVDAAVGAGWRPLLISESTLEEFDTWESDWRAGLELSGHPDALALAAERRAEYFGTYRGVLGFAWLILLRPA